MGKGQKFISSKETYFKRADNTLTLDAWEQYKQAHPQVQYTGEICWELHDLMILRGKPASDKAFVKILLNEANIEFEQNVDYLKITSDLTGQQIIVIEIEDDELLEQLELAGATVLYITSNPNYNINTPDKYFQMYLESYNAEDFPAEDKRHLFDGKNIIVEYISFAEYKNKQYKQHLQNIIKEHNMKTNKVLMNPPYDKTLHLQILEAVSQFMGPTCEIVNISPIGWLENPVLQNKARSPFKPFLTTILPKIKKLFCIDATTACKAFNIEGGVDLGIYVLSNNTSTHTQIKVLDDVAVSCINKICFSNIKSLASKCTSGVSGWRCEVKDLTFGAGGHNQGDAESSKQCAVKLVLGPYNNGYDENGKFFTETRQKNQNTKDWFKGSIEFTTKAEATNFYLSCNTNFYKRLIQLLNVNGDPQHEFLPFMPTYQHAWTDKDFCEYFNLTKAEADFMCKDITDYRVKDFINYTKLDEE